MITRTRSLLIVLVLLLAAPAAAEITALVGATVHPVSSAPIQNGIVLIEDGRIQAIGADIAVPDGALVIDLAGLHLYPGFVHPATQLGLTEISSVPGSVDTTEMGSINAALRAEVAVNHDSALLPVAIAGGVLNAHVMPGGGLIRGTSAVLRLNGWSWEEMIVQSPAAMHLAFPAGAADDKDNDDLALIDETLDKARHWHAAEAAAGLGQAPRPARNDQLQALGPLLAGEVPLMIHVNGISAIEAALDWAQAQQFERIILSANADVQYAAERLAAEDIPVILRGVYNMPTRRWEAYDMAYVAAARLHQAGVRFAIGDSGGGMDVANARNLPFHAGTAAAHGLAKDAALKSVTLWPAQILGVGDRLGSIEPGKQASLFAATGDPLEPMSQIVRVWIDGDEYDLGMERHRRLYERYRLHQQAGSP
ncbi:MAG: amidohydrolase family protein [Wenzhouxiangella sp.]|nr:amidohydrolase family protein [Wenzhouxiangella sp.]